jgi:hypothetical protein
MYQASSLAQHPAKLKPHEHVPHMVVHKMENEVWNKACNAGGTAQQTINCK